MAFFFRGDSGGMGFAGRVELRVTRVEGSTVSLFLGAIVEVKGRGKDVKNILSLKKLFSPFPERIIKGREGELK